MAQTYQLIQSTVLAANAANIVFSSIPNTYTHLELLIQARSTHTQPNDFVLLRYNGDSTAGAYAYSSLQVLSGYLTTENGSVSSSSFTGFCAISGDNNQSNIFGISRIVIPEYKNTSVAKTGFAVGNSAYGTGFTSSITLQGLYWNSTAAISSITLLLNSGNNFKPGSTFQLYGFTKA